MEEKKKTNSNALIILGLIAVVVACAMISCGISSFLLYNRYKAVNEQQDLYEDIGSALIEPTAEANSWPSTIPSIIPVFTACKINNSIVSSTLYNNIWVISLENCTEQDVTDYQELLTAQGWRIIPVRATTGKIRLLATSGKHQISVTFSGSTDNLIFSVSESK